MLLYRYTSYLDYINILYLLHISTADIPMANDSFADKHLETELINFI